MKKGRILLAGLASVLLIGAGCAGSAEPEAPAETDGAPAAAQTPPADTQAKQAERAADKGDATEEQPIILKGEALGGGTVMLTWDVHESVENIDGFRFAWGEEENPRFPAQYWWQRGPAHRELEWKNLPTGNGHIRACILVDGQCSIFSNDLALEIL